MRLILALVVLSLSIVACTRQNKELVAPIVEVNGKYLTKAELDAEIPKNLSPEDSTLAAEYFVRLWINDQLMYSVASANIADKDKLESLVENYRKSLTIYQYEEQLIAEKLSREISNEALLGYFENNKEKFKIDRPLIKGLFLKVPINAPDIDIIKKWYKLTTPKAIDFMEKYSIKNAVGYNYFLDNWVDFNDLMENWPVNYKNESTMVKSNNFIEQQDANYYYLLNITAYLLPGDNAPFEYAQTSVKEILINQRKIDFLKEIREDLYNKALNNGRIIFYNEQYE
jgi:hypothetical protein